MGSALKLCATVVGRCVRVDHGNVLALGVAGRELSAASGDIGCRSTSVRTRVVALVASTVLSVTRSIVANVTVSSSGSEHVCTRR